MIKMKRTLAALVLAMLVFSPAFAQKAPKNEKVRNIIFLIGDGMGLGAASAWMLENGYQQTCFDRAQFVGIAKTYSANNRVTDSAASGTAMATGEKTNNGMLGMKPDGSEPASIAELAKAKGMKTGVIVTSYVLDATPGAFFAHAKGRGENKDIVQDFMQNRTDILAGGGRKYFTDPKYTDENLIEKLCSEGYTYCATPEEFYAAPAAPVIGLFSDGSYPGAAEHGTDYLRDVMTHSLSLLEGKKGFFVMVEGSHIDHAAHANNPQDLMFEMEEFDKCVNAAFDYADTHKGTLVVVAADHETGGVSLLSNNKDYTQGESGIDIKFATTGHSGVPVMVYAYGASAWKFSGVMENTDLFKKMKELLIDGKK